VTYSGSLICWYPLPYNYGYYNYNSVYVDRRRYNRTIINNTTVVVNPTLTNNKRQRVLNGVPVESVIPPSGVVAVETNDFGKRTRSILPAPIEVAKKALSKTPFENENPPLPDYRNVKSKMNREIVAEIPRNEQVAMRVKTGATERKIGVPVDENLRKERIYGNRQPREKTPPSIEAGENPGKVVTRDTGAVKRVPRQIINQEGGLETGKPVPRETPPDSFPTRSRSGKTNNENDDTPVSKPRNRVKEMPAPIYEPPQQQQERQERKEQRRQIPPQETPRSEPPPKREETREAKPPQREKQSPKEERKVSPPTKDKSEKLKPDNN
jgi:hypothetical protein